MGRKGKQMDQKALSRMLKSLELEPHLPWRALELQFQPASPTDFDWQSLTDRQLPHSTAAVWDFHPHVT